MTEQSLFPETEESVIKQLDARILSLLTGHSGGPLGLTLENAERVVLSMLRYRRGRERSVAICEIERLTDLKPREIKQAVRTLRLSFRLPIGSSKHSAEGGYYLMITDEDRAAWRHDIIAQIRAEVEVLRAADSDRAALEALGQLQMEIGQ